VEVGAGHVGEVGPPHDPHAEPGQALPGRHQVVDLEDGHVAGVAAPAVEVPACRGVRPDGETTSRKVSPAAKTALARPNSAMPGSA
jgi:hypothetical protein